MNSIRPSEKRRADKWAALSGKWEFEKQKAVYLGPASDSRREFPVGLARSSLRFLDGTLHTKIKLSQNTATSAGFFMRFQSSDAPYAVATIGGWDSAYAIGEYRPGFGFLARKSAGSLSNLNIEEPHDVYVSVVGQSIRMIVDDVEVLNTVFSVPLEGTGFGLYTFGEASVEFNETAVEGGPPKIFVMMPFAEPFDTLYRKVIHPVASRLGFEVIRVDEVAGPGIIIEDIQRQIESSHAVVAEISTQNPNVFYELGYAHALRKPAILLVRRSDGSSMPFDIRSYRAIFYDDSIGGKEKVERNLEQHLNAVLGA